MSNLTGKQLAFAQAIAEGKNDSDAHRLAYGGNLKMASRNRMAHEVRHNPKVAAEIARLQAMHDKNKFLTRESKRKHLAKLVNSTKAKNNDRLKAIEIDNVMTGDNAPQQVNVFGLGELLAMVRGQ